MSWRKDLADWLGSVVACLFHLWLLSLAISFVAFCIKAMS